MPCQETYQEFWKYVGRLVRVLSFSRIVLHQFVADQCFNRAAALAYTTLLTLVPLAVVGFAVFSAFPVFEPLATQLQEFVFRNFVPASGEVIREYLEQFSRQSSGLTALGMALLVVSALLLMHAIEDTFNTIWHVIGSRNLIASSVAYLLVLVVGPVLIGASLAVTTYIVTLPFITKTAGQVGMGEHLLEYMPFLFVWLAFALVYKFVPHIHVSMKHAALGSFIAAVLFELAKVVFAWYVTGYSTYQVIYGALASIPVFLVWVYISWVIILLGAVTTYCLKNAALVSSYNDKSR